MKKPTSLSSVDHLAVGELERLLAALIASSTEPTCCATTESTSRSMRLNSSKQPQQPLCASPLKMRGRAVVHLIAAVGDEHVLAERAAHVLGRLGLARAGGAGGRAAEEHAERLRERDVAAVGERRDHEPLLDAEVLVAVVEVDVGDGDLGDVEVVAPVEARLLLPLEVLGVA